MDRKHFIKVCGFACLGGIGMSSLLQGCSAVQPVNGKIISDDLVVPISEFESKKRKEQ